MKEEPKMRIDEDISQIPEENEEKFILKQTKGGAYSSFPKAEDILNEMGLKEVNNSIFLYDQTIDGAYNSRPKAKDVYDLLHDDLRLWQESERQAMDNGHGEYVGNVETAAKYCESKGARSVEDIERLLKDAEIEER